MEYKFTAESVRKMMPDTAGYSENMRKIIEACKKRIETRAKQGYYAIDYAVLLNEREGEDKILDDFLHERGFRVIIVKGSPDVTEKLQVRDFIFNINWQ